MGLLLGISLPVSGFVSAEEARGVVSKTVQGDTVRISWYSDYDANVFSFQGEQGATYVVDWGDEKTDTVIGEGADRYVVCKHDYSQSGIYNVLLYGIGTAKNK